MCWFKIQFGGRFGILTQDACYLIQCKAMVIYIYLIILRHCLILLRAHPARNRVPVDRGMLAIQYREPATSIMNAVVSLLRSMLLAGVKRADKGRLLTIARVSTFRIIRRVNIGCPARIVGLLEVTA